MCNIIFLVMKRKIAAILTLGTIAVLYGSYYIGIPLLTNNSKFESFLENRIYAQSGIKIDFIKPRFRAGVIPSLIFKADGVNVINPDGTNSLEVKNPYLSIKLLPLLYKNVSVSKLQADSVLANLRYGKDKNFYIGQYPIKFGQQPIFTLRCIAMNISQYAVNLDDEVQNKKLKIDGNSFVVHKYKKDKRLKFSVDSNLYAGGDISSLVADVDVALPITKIKEDNLKVDIALKNLDLADFSEYANTLSKGEIVSLRGKIDLYSNTDNVQGHKNIKSDLMIDKLGIFLKDNVESIYCDYPLVISNDVNVINDGVKINNLKLITKGIDLFLSGGVYKTNAKFPNLDLKATVNNAEGKYLLPLFPGFKDLNPDFDFHKLKENYVSGKATGNMEIKGEANYPHLGGSILLTDVLINRPIKGAPQNGIVKLMFKDHTMNLDVHVMTAPAEFVDVKGSFKLFKERYSDITVKTTNKIDLVEAKRVLMPLRDVFKFELGPVPILDVPAGTGNANFRIAGTRTEPHAWGSINFNNGVASFITINNMVAKNIAGWVKFNGEDVTFKTTSLTLNNLPVDVNGKCSMRGDVTVDIKGDNQNSADLLKIVNTSPILGELQHMLAPITSGSGKTKLKMTIFGHVDRGVMPVFNKDLFARGSIEFVNNVMTFFPQKVPVSNINGIVNFDKKDGNFKIDANLVNSTISTNGVIKNNILTANAYSNRFNAGDGWKIARLFYGNRILPVPGINTVNTSFSGHYKGIINIDRFDYSKIIAKGKVYNNYGSKSPIIVNNSDFNIKNGHVHISPIRGVMKGNPFNMQVDIDHLMTPKQVYNGTFSMKKFDMAALNGLSIPEIPQFKDLSNFNGTVDIASKIINNNIRLYTQINNTEFVYNPKNLKIKIADGTVLYDKDDVNLNRINAHLGEMPVFLNGKISNISSDNPNMNLYVNAKPSQEFFDQFINAKSVYPIKLKGDIIVSSKLQGPVSGLYSKTNLKLDENSSVYYMGATVGDLTGAVNIYADCLSGKDWVKINNFKYDKIVTSQNGKKFPNSQLTASGGIKFAGTNNLKFTDFRVKTHTPTDAKIFNIIFRKPFIKQGVFMADMLINGDMLAPKITGNLDVTGIDVPVVDATVKDVKFLFKPDNIHINSNSLIMDNKMVLDAVMQNRLVSPYIFNDVKLHFNKLDLNVISDAMQNYDANLYKQNLGVEQGTKSMPATDVIVKSGTVTADIIRMQQLDAKDFIANFTINKNKIAKVKNYSIKLVDGTLFGNGEYDIKNKKLKLVTEMKGVNAQNLADNLFNLKSQCYGAMSGKLSIQCFGSNQEECLKSMKGNGKFDIIDGRMPKLGSLEYLLKATNIVSSGITRISINNIIDLITPLKTGNFKSIKGHFDINKGIVENLEIFSKGQDLNLYLSGSYNIETYIANMEVYGTLSNNLTSVFGKLKNFSLNTLLNTIPFLNNTEYSPEVAEKIKKVPSDSSSSVARIFAVIIDGDINGLSYVKSFKWVK